MEEFYEPGSIERIDRRSVFFQLMDSEEEATDLFRRSDIMNALVRFLDDHPHWSTKDAACILEVRKRTIRDIRKGRIDRLSLAQLQLMWAAVQKYYRRYANRFA